MRLFEIVRCLVDYGHIVHFVFCTEVFENSRATLKDHILHWGYLPSKAQFLKVLESADIAVSTALHEFFGVSM